MDPSTNGEPRPEARREELEGRYTRWRIAELEASPVVGNFDAAHLKEVNRRIFQDLPGAGFADVTPGEFRPPVAGGRDWMKQRRLSTVNGSIYVTYSRMDEVATARLDKALEAARPDELRALKTPEFTARIATMYAELDYVHPFSDGNSRTLRSFTRQLARESGYELEWERFGRDDAGRDLLYIPRDRCVNELAKPQIRQEDTMRQILRTQHALKGYRALPDLLVDALRPSRALAFEAMTEREALKEFPELKAAYKTMHTATACFESKMPGQPEAQEACIQSVMKPVQDRLKAGETLDFRRVEESGRNTQ